MPNAILNLDGPEMWMNIDEGSIWASDRDEKPVNFRPYEVQIKSPSEHRINGQEYDAEMQIVLYAEKGKVNAPKAVISVFFDSALAYYHNDFVDSLGVTREDNPRNVNASRDYKTTSKDVNFADFMNSLDVSTYYEYQGSLT